MSEFFLVHGLTLLWAAALIVFLVIEAATANLVTIWFAVGALAALLVSLIFPSFLLQALVFAAVSVLALVITRPLLVRFRNRKTANALGLERNIGHRAVVCVPIRPGKAGRVTLEGVDWQAVCDTPLEAGDPCIVQKVNCTTLEVIPVKTAEVTE